MPRKLRLTLAVLATGVTAAIIGVIVFVLATGSNGPELVDTQITVEEIVNQVETERRGQGLSFLPAQVGQELIPGDAVKTFLASEARVDIVVLPFTRITRTTPNTTWRLGQFGLDQDVIIELIQGKIFLIDQELRDGQQPIQVVTPAGNASPRGTWISVQYDPNEGVMEVQCFRGVCELKNELGTQVLTDELKSTSTAQTAPTEPIAMDQDERNEFTELPEARSGEVAVPAPAVVPPTLTPTSIPTPAPEPADTPVLAPESEAASAPIPTPILTPITVQGSAGADGPAGPSGPRGRDGSQGPRPESREIKV